MKKPNFFIVGAPRCGTTALSEYLRGHPNVFFSQPKEIGFFATDFPGSRVITRFEDYMALFNDVQPDHLRVGEGSVWYMYSREAARNIHEYNPKAKLIVMLRNPVDLVHSLHSQLLLSIDEIVLFFGSKYINATGALIWLLPGIVLGSLSRILSNDIAAKGKPELNMYVAFFVVSVNIIANIILIPAMGINGAALATTIAYSVNAIAKLYLYARLSGNMWWQPLLLDRTDIALIFQRVKAIHRSIF